MKKKVYLVRKTLLFVIIILFISIIINPSTGTILEKQLIKHFSNGNILYVGGTGLGNYTTIHLAIKDASDGDTVFVFHDSSPYFENLRVIKSINLIGEDWNNTIIDGINHRQATIHILVDWVNISGFTIKNGNGGIRINSNNNTITRNFILDNYWGGLSLKNAKFNKITGNKIINNFYGIQINEKSSYNIISSNLIRKSYHTGIMIGNPIVPLLLIEKIDNPANGLDDSNFNIIIKNTLINPIKNAAFFDYQINTWDQNYWGRPRIFPKIISGSHDGYKPWINIDWNPAFLPYERLF